MKIVKGVEKIRQQFDFFEGYVSKIEWSKDLFDLIISVNYFWQDNNNCQNKEVKIILKDCTQATFNSPQNSGICSDIDKSMAKSYVLYSIQLLNIEKENDKWRVIIYTTELEHKWLDALCSEMLVEY